MFFLLIFIGKHLEAQNNALDVLNEWVEWSNGENMLQLYLSSQAYSMIDGREQEVSLLKTKEDWERRQHKVKEIYTSMIGAFPQRDSLNARITGTIYKDDFRIEKIVYESIPDFYVTGCLFIPIKIQKKNPAILYVSGHSVPGFRYAPYQKVILNLVKKGFIVFAIDPIGQGERLQYFDPKEKKSTVGGSTREHTYPGLQCFLSGMSINNYFVWDGIRAIDYLQTRKEVDMNRIGITGRSGGGTQTVLISAFDERIKAAAPENYVTRHRRLMESIGPQDAEQNFIHWFTNKVTLEDLLIMRIPKPVLLVTTSRDIFSIQGAREVYNELSKGYVTFDKGANLKMVEDDAEHASTRQNNEAIYRFFQAHLSLPGSPYEEDVEPLDPYELSVTPTGQVSTSINGKTIFDLNKKKAEELYDKIRESRTTNEDHLKEVISNSIHLSGFNFPNTNSGHVYTGCYQREGYRICTYILFGKDKQYVIPLLLAVPDATGIFSSVIVIHPEGKKEAIERYMEKGYVVAFPDLLGSGETKPQAKFPAATAFEAMLIGKSIVGIQAEDIVRVVHFLKRMPYVDSTDIQAIAYKESCPALLHAAAYEKSIKGIALIDAPISYYSISQTKMYNYPLSFTWGVTGALTAYDLPDLMAAIAPFKIAIMQSENVQTYPNSNDHLDSQLSFPSNVFKELHSDNLKILRLSSEQLEPSITDWLRK